MAHIFEDRVMETSTTTGTGAMTLAGAVTGFRTFASQMTSPSDTCWYSIWAVNSDGQPTGEWEVGLGTYSASNTLTRTTVLESSNSGSAVSFSGGTKYVALALPSQRNLQLDNANAARFPIISSEPTTPAAGFALLYFKEIAGIGVLRYRNAQGLDHDLQIAMRYNGFCGAQGGQGTVSVIGISALTVTGTVAAGTLASTGLNTSIPYTSFTTSNTAGSLSTAVHGQLRAWRGNAAGLGGYQFTVRFSLSVIQAGIRAYFGLADVTSAPTNVDPTTNTTPGKIGLAINTNTGNWNLVHNVTGTAPTVVALGSDFPVNTTNVMELHVAVQPNGGGFGYRIRNLTSGLETSGSITTNQPANTTFLTPIMWITNNASTGQPAFRFYKWTLESDN